MTPLIIEKTQSIPSITLDKRSGTFSFEGKSIPDNVEDLYKPILNWIEKYIKDPNQNTRVDFKFDYFNTASSKKIHDILVQFSELPKNNFDLIVNWYVNEDDDDMLDGGKELSGLIPLPFNFIKH